MSKTTKVRNGLQYQPMRQYDEGGLYTATRIEVTIPREVTIPQPVKRPSKRARFKAFLRELGKGAAYAIRS